MLRPAGEPAAARRGVGVGRGPLCVTPLTDERSAHRAKQEEVHHGRHHCAPELERVVDVLEGSTVSGRFGSRQEFEVASFALQVHQGPSPGNRTAASGVACGG